MLLSLITKYLAHFVKNTKAYDTTLTVNMKILSYDFSALYRPDLLNSGACILPNACWDVTPKSISDIENGLNGCGISAEGDCKGIFDILHSFIHLCRPHGRRFLLSSSDPWLSKDI